MVFFFSLPPLVIFLLLLLLLLPQCAHANKEEQQQQQDEEKAQAQCSNGDWFAMNAYNFFVQPIVERTTFVMSPTSSSSSSSFSFFSSSCPPSRFRGETCEALGVRNGLDVLAVALRVLTGWRIPLALHDDYCVFESCPQLASVSEVSEVARHGCRLATRTMRCAWELWHYGLGWLCLLLSLAGGLVIFLTVNMCVLALGGCGCGSSSRRGM